MNIEINQVIGENSFSKAYGSYLKINAKYHGQSIIFSYQRNFCASCQNGYFNIYKKNDSIYQRIYTAQKKYRDSQIQFSQNEDLIFIFYSEVYESIDTYTLTKEIKLLHKQVFNTYPYICSIYISKRINLIQYQRDYVKIYKYFNQQFEILQKFKDINYLWFEFKRNTLLLSKIQESCGIAIYKQNKQTLFWYKIQRIQIYTETFYTNPYCFEEQLIIIEKFELYYKITFYLLNQISKLFEFNKSIIQVRNKEFTIEFHSIQDIIYEIFNDQIQQYSIKEQEFKLQKTIFFKKGLDGYIPQQGYAQIQINNGQNLEKLFDLLY